eukprot:gene4027-2881_t
MLSSRSNFLILDCLGDRSELHYGRGHVPLREESGGSMDDPWDLPGFKFGSVSWVHCGSGTRQTEASEQDNFSTRKRGEIVPTFSRTRYLPLELEMRDVAVNPLFISSLPPTEVREMTRRYRPVVKNQIQRSLAYKDYRCHSTGKNDGEESCGNKTFSTFLYLFFFDAPLCFSSLNGLGHSDALRPPHHTHTAPGSLLVPTIRKEDIRCLSFSPHNSAIVGNWCPIWCSRTHPVSPSPFHLWNSTTGPGWSPKPRGHLLLAESNTLYLQHSHLYRLLFFFLLLFAALIERNASSEIHHRSLLEQAISPTHCATHRSSLLPPPPPPEGSPGVVVCGLLSRQSKKERKDCRIHDTIEKEEAPPPPPASVEVISSSLQEDEGHLAVCRLQLPAGTCALSAAFHPPQDGSSPDPDTPTAIYSDETFLLFVEQLHRQVLRTGLKTRSDPMLPILQLDPKGTPGAYRLSHPPAAREHSPIPLQPAHRGQQSSPESSEEQVYREVSDRIHHPMPREMVDALPLSRDAKRGLEVKSYAEYVKVLQEMERRAPGSVVRSNEPQVSHRAPQHPAAAPPASIPAPEISATRQRLDRAAVMDNLLNSSNASSPSKSATSMPPRSPFKKQQDGSSTQSRRAAPQRTRAPNHRGPPRDNGRYASGVRHFPPRQRALIEHRPSPLPQAPPRQQPPFPDKDRSLGTDPPTTRNRSDEVRSRSRSASDDYRQIFARPPVSAVYAKYLSETVEQQCPLPPSLAAKNVSTFERVSLPSLV